MTKREKMFKYIEIAERAEKEGLYKGERMDLLMDIESADLAFDLRLDDWLKADKFNFAHDLLGIMKNIVREQFPATDFGFFVPRFARPKASVKEKSVIDSDVIEKYEKETSKEWTDTEERMAIICSFYDYGFAWNEKGNIVINNNYYGEHHKEFYKFFGGNIELDSCSDKIVEVYGIKINTSELDSDLRHYEYESAEEMVKDWSAICKDTNEDYKRNNLKIPFKWVD